MLIIFLRSPLCLLLALAIVDSASAATIANAKAAADSTVITNVTGIVTSVGGATGRLQFTIQDATGGIIIDKGTASYTQPQPGDSVTVVNGVKTTFNGLIELQPATSADIIINSAANPLPAPLTFTTLFAFLQADATYTQSMYIQVKNLCLTGTLPNAAGSTTWLSPAATGNANYTVTDNGNETAILRLPSDLAGTAAIWRAKERPAVSTADRFDVYGTAGIFGGVLQLSISAPTGGVAKTSSTGPVRVATTRGYNPATGDFARGDPAQIRIAAYNTLDNLGNPDPTARAALNRLLRVIDPDIVCFTEVDPNRTANDLRTELNALMPLPAGQQWTVHIGPSDGFNVNVLATRQSMSMQTGDTVPASDLRGLPAALITPSGPAYRLGAYVMGAHLKCCQEPGATARRQKHCDAIAKWVGDLRTPGGSVDLPADTPIFAIGDFNLVDPDPQQPEVTLRTGDIQNEATYGPDIKGDWDNSDLTDLKPSDPYTGDLDTWPSGSTNPTSRLDRIYYTDSRVTAAQSFVLNTRTMPFNQRTAAGLRFNDSETVSDHLPIIIDVAQVSFPVQLSQFSVE